MWMNGSLTVVGGGVLTPFQRKICSSALQSEQRTGLAEGAGYTLLEKDKDRAGSEDMLSVLKTGNTVGKMGIRDGRGAMESLGRINNGLEGSLLERLGYLPWKEHWLH